MHHVMLQHALQVLHEPEHDEHRRDDTEIGDGEQQDVTRRRAEHRRMAATTAAAHAHSHQSPRRSDSRTITMNENGNDTVLFTFDAVWTINAAG